MIKSLKTWILVANASRARIVENHGVGRGIVAVEGTEFSNDVTHGRDVYADRPGRVHDSAGPGRHAMEPPTAAKEQSVAVFSRSLAAYLQDHLRRGTYDRLILIAEPSFLGHLRASLAKPVVSVVHAELAKDLTRETDEGLASQLESVLAI